MPQRTLLFPPGPVRALPTDPFDWSVEQVCAFVALHDASNTRITRGRLLVKAGICVHIDVQTSNANQLEGVSQLLTGAMRHK